MFTVLGPKHSRTGGLLRRDFLRLGGLGLAGLSLADLLRLDAQGQTTDKGRGKSIIYVVLGGGPSHIDMWDMKPDAPAEVRGEFKSIPTKMTGVRVCEHMPRQAAIFDKFALVRGIQSVENDHFLSEVYSGLPRGAGNRPAFGSVASRMIGGTQALPTYVSLSRATTDQFEFEKPYYAGASHTPFRPFGEALEDMKPVASLERLKERKGLLDAFDTMRRDLDAADRLGGMDRFTAQALDIITSSKVREAFDLSREPDRVRHSYGGGKYQYITVNDPIFTWEAEQFLLARRLVEAGVRVVTLRVGQWDHHSGFSGSIFPCLKSMLPLFDHSLEALITDLEVRGLDKDVLVVVLGEFGRTPKIANPGPGRDHWAEAGCALFAGGGLKVGQVIGETDARAERARSGSITFQNIFATMYRVLGIDPAAQLVDFRGRPQSLLEHSESIAELEAPTVPKVD